MAKHRIKREDLAVGQPLSVSAYDDDGNLMLKEGEVIGSDVERDALLERGIYYYGPARNAAENGPLAKVTAYPFEIIDEIYTELNFIFSRSAYDLRLPSKIVRLCTRLQTASEHDHDACLGMISFGHYYRYPVMHSIHTSLVCNTILMRLGWPPEQRIMPMAAAMTMNISMIGLQEKLCSQSRPLTAKQHEEIFNHPERSAEILQECGVSDEVWLQTIAQHHELLDGSGYPHAQTEEAITPPARVVALGDIYGAKISNRTYRKPILPTDVMRELFLNKSKCLDLTMSKILIKKLGLFPPGSFVELNNGEVGVVTRVGNDARHPVVCSVIKANGTAHAVPVVRDCTIKTFGIKKIITRNEARIEVNRYQLWG
jgi:HD-GYP domain-containing protein (c-di-GMP phosphodiesterase class II)